MTHAGISLAVLATLLLSGCAGSPRIDADAAEPVAAATETSIQIPDFRGGDAWNEWLLWSGPDGPVEFRRSYFLEPEARPLLDAYGIEFLGQRLVRRTALDGPPIEDRHTFIESSRGAWVGEEILAANDTMRPKKPVTDPLAGASPECVYEVPPMWAPWYARQAIHRNDGSLRGSTLRVGDRIEAPWTFEGHSVPDGKMFFNVTTRVKVEVGGEPVEAIWVTVEPRLPQSRDLLDFESLVHESKEPKVRWLMGHGIPVPILVEVNDVIQQKVTMYQAGAKRLDLVPTRRQALLDGVHPDGVPDVIGLAPVTAGVPLDFPFTAAMTAIGRSPQAVGLNAWLATHPAAYVQSATYLADQQNRTYRWWLVFTDADGWMTARAKRTVVGSELPVTVDAADAPLTPSGNAGSDLFPAPSEVRGMRFVQLAADHNNAQAFYGASESTWDSMRWSFYKEDQPNGAPPELRLSYSLAPGVYKEKRTGPFTTGYMLAHGYDLHIDGAEARVQGLVTASMLCYAGLEAPAFLSTAEAPAKAVDPDSFKPLWWAAVAG